MSEPDSAFFEAFGRLAVEFAKMEAGVRLLLVGIAFGGDKIAASPFLDSSQLTSNLTILRKLSRQFHDNQTRIEELVSSVDRLRSKRNLFIHGVWSPGSFQSEQGSAYVTDLKITYEASENSKTWISGRSQSLSKSDFVSMHEEVLSVISEIEVLAECLKYEEADLGD